MCMGRLSITTCVDLPFPHNKVVCEPKVAVCGSIQGTQTWSLVPRLFCTLDCFTDLLRHLMFGDIVHLLKVMEDVCDLVIPLPPCVLCSENVFVSFVN